METVQGKAFDSASVLKRWYRAIPRHMKAAFLSALLVGLLVHLYMLTNKLPNHDDIAGTFISIDFLGYGRWLSRFIEQVNTNLSMPWVNGMFALIFAALSAALVVQILNIRNTFFTGLAGAVLTCIPFMANVFTFMCAADVFLLAVFLGVLGVYFFDRSKFGFLLCAGLFTFVLAIYQTMALFAIALLMMKILLDVLDRGRSNSEVVRAIWRSLASVAIAAVLYVGLTKLILHINSAELVYANTADILSPKFSEMPQRILQCYQQFVAMALSRSPYFNTHWMLGLYLLIVFSFCLLVGLLLVQNKQRSVWRTLVAVLLVLVFPVVLFSGYLAAGYAHILMLLPFSMLFFGLIALFCQFDSVVDSNSPKNIRFLRTLGSWFVTLAMIACCYSWALYSNQAYFTLERKFDACYSLATRIVDCVEQLPEYTPETPVLIVGDFSAGNYPVAVPEAQDGLPYSVGIGEPSEFYYMKGYWGTVQTFIAAYLGIRWPTPDAKTVSELVEETNDFSGLPIFPAQGSVLYLNGVIVVVGSDS
jgi:hypothetical protein